MGKLIKFDGRCFAMEMADEGYVSFEDIALMCLKYMSSDDVIDMLEANEYSDLMKEYGYGL